MKQRIGIVLFAFGLVMLSITACNKDSSQTYPVYRTPVPQVLWDYGYFQIGSYWVFQDSTSLILDSIYVTSSNEGTIESSPTNSNTYYDYYGYFNVYTQDPVEGRQYHNYVNMQFADQLYAGLYEEKLMMPVSEQTWLMTNYFVPGQSFLPLLSETYGEVFFENKFDSLKVLASYFKNVMFFRDSKNGTQNNSITNTYLAQNIGVVRKEIMATHTVWNLIRYHIVQ